MIAPSAKLHYPAWLALLLLILVALSVPVIQTLWALGLLSSLGSAVSQGVVLSATIIASGVSICALLLIWQWRRLAQHQNTHGTSLTVWRYFGIQRFGLRDFLPCLAWLIIVMLGVELIGHLLNLKPSEFMRPLLIGTPPWLLFITVSLIVPIYEELIFRGMAWQLAKDIFIKADCLRASLYASLLISAIFALIHLQYALIEMLMVAALSLVFCYARWRTGSLIAPLLLHMINNGLAFTLMMTD